MGNACCEEHSEFKHYNPAHKGSMDINPSTINVSAINFPTAKIPIRS